MLQAKSHKINMLKYVSTSYDLRSGNIEEKDFIYLWIIYQKYEKKFVVVTKEKYYTCWKKYKFQLITKRLWAGITLREEIHLIYIVFIYFLGKADF